MYWAFYKSTVTINLVVSLMVGLVTVSITVFAIGLVTFGLFFAFLYKEVVRPQEYYFYFNRGISKIKLIIFCILVNILPSALILIILQLCRIILK
jgi:Zn-dependent protease